MDEPTGSAADKHAIPRVVLDTNACLDLFLFRDPRAGALSAALQAGRLHAVTDAACREEWLRVLQYPQLGLDEAARASAVAAFDAIVDCVAVGDSQAALPSLPRCGDPDDQKFLELARNAGASWLVSRDVELLRLGRRTRRDGLFDIIEPQAWPLATERGG
jgi:predicted nucleic acid-binding protein